MFPSFPRGFSTPVAQGIRPLGRCASCPGVGAPPGRPSLVFLLAATLPSLTLLGCDLPTTMPEWESTWEIPGDSVRMDMSGLLPAGITEEGDSTFVVTPPSFVVRAALADLCPPCAALGGIVLPKPAITTSFQDHGDLPDDVLGVTLRSGSVEFRVTNGLGFDPIRPGGSTRGSLRLLLRSEPDGRVLADTILSGSTHALPPGGSLLVTLPLLPGEVGARVMGQVTLDSPAGNPAPIRGRDSFQVEVTPGVLRVSEARVDGRGRALAPTSVALGAEEIEEGILDRMQGGRLRLDIDNPFGVGASLTVRLDAPGEQPVQRALEVAPGGGMVVLDYSGAELRRFLGREGARWTVEGVVDTEAGPVTIRPGAAAVVRGSFLLTLTLGG